VAVVHACGVMLVVPSTCHDAVLIDALQSDVNSVSERQGEQRVVPLDKEKTQNQISLVPNAQQ
jgi:hypothetical protein